MSSRNPCWITGESHFLCTERDHLTLILWHDRPDNLIANCLPNFTQTSFNRAWIRSPLFPVLLRWKSEASAFFLATDGVTDNQGYCYPLTHKHNTNTIEAQQKAIEHKHTNDKMKKNKNKIQHTGTQIQGGFFNWSARFSVPKWKTSCSQPGLVFHEIFNVKKLLVGWASFFHFGTENRGEQLKNHRVLVCIC